MTDLHTENARLRAALADLVAGGNRQLAIISRRVKHTDPMTLIVTKGQMLAAMNALATPAPDAVQEAARVPEIAALIEAAAAFDAAISTPNSNAGTARVRMSAALRAIAGETE